MVSHQGVSQTLSAFLPGWAHRRPPTPPYVVGVVPGEGIGPEVVGAALTVLDAVAEVHGLSFDVTTSGGLGRPGPFGATLHPAVDGFVEAIFAAGGAVLCGAVGGRFVYELRARFALFCKFLPVRPSPAVADASIVRPERLHGADVLLVRDNVGGLYQGQFGRRDGGRTAFQELVYRADQVDGVLAVAARAAVARRGRLTLIAKAAGIPEVSALWRERAEALAADVGFDLEEMEVDNACFQLVADPRRFDVVVAPNLLGDVVADSAMLTLGSRGMAPSVNFGNDGRAVYQTGHGAAHILAGRDEANPVAQILSLALLLRESFGLPAAAAAVETAVETVLGAGYRTGDLAGPTSTVVGTRELADRIVAAIACG
ncbi:MAG: 3-isopropylmalate dehydrogenase [Actinomycetota bacterium]|nr:3-isopropylmalate dehydrogenase [Actinomycetota bacterium]